MPEFRLQSGSSEQSLYQPIVKTAEKTMPRTIAIGDVHGCADEFEELLEALELAFASGAHELKRDLGRVGKAVDRQRWEMSPPTVNAYYHPQKNQMTVWFNWAIWSTVAQTVTVYWNWPASTKWNRFSAIMNSVYYAHDGKAATSS